jgi:hypothetical protein
MTNLPYMPSLSLSSPAAYDNLPFMPMWAFCHRTCSITSISQTLLRGRWRHCIQA